MRHIYIKQITIENFKGIRSLTIHLDRKVRIYGKNASGKTTILDAVLWLLFGKDSQGRTDFQIRPVDEYGQMIDNVEIAVEATLEVDGETIVLRKTQKQNWVKKRGSATATLQGNVNDMEVNGFPTSQRDYEDTITKIMSEKLFLLMTNPVAFSMLPWKEQREMLLRFVSEITDKDVLELDEDRFAPIADDILAAGADKAREKAYSTLKRLKDEQAAYPVRIDEAMRSRVPAMPERDVLARKEKAETELEIIRNERDNLDASLKSYTDIQDQIVGLRIKAGDIKSKAEADYARQKMDVKTAVTDAMMKVKSLEQRRDRLSDSLSDYTNTIATGEEDIAELSRQYTEVKSRMLPEDETTCPTCGREFDADKIAEIQSEFEKRKSRDLGRIESRGRSIRDSINITKQRLSDTHKQIDALTEQIVQADAEYKRLMDEAKEVRMPDYIMFPEYIELNKQLVELSEQLENVDDGTERRGALKGREMLARQELDDANNDLVVIEANKRADARVAELKEKQRECSQKVSDAEQALFLIEEFTKLKMDTLSDRINEHFKRVRFRLFKTLINGSVQPCCVMQIATNGSYVDYPNANHAGQILGGLDVIGALSELYQVSAPVFIDNFECISHPETVNCNSQLIMLVVSKDEQLTVSQES